jgi:phosphoserine phosphatase RsbU/P
VSTKLSSSITAKLFYLITSLVLLVVIGLTLQSTSKFKQNLSQNIQDGALAQAERSASELANQLDAISTKVSVALPKITIGENNKGTAKDELKSILRNDPEILTAGLFFASDEKLSQIEAVTTTYPENGTVENRYEGRNAEDTKNKVQETMLAEIKEITADNVTTNVIVRSIASKIGLPIMAVIIKFDFDGPKHQKIYVALSMWQTRLIVALPKSKTTSSIVIDSQASIFLSSDLTDLIKQKSLKGSPLARSAVSRVTPSGFQDVYKDAGGVEKLGAFSQVTGYPNLFVLVEKDANAAFKVIDRSYYSATLWAILFTLVAVMASLLGAGTATKSIKDLLAVTKEISTGNFSARVQLQTTDEIAELGSSVNHMAGKITELMSNQVEKARFEKELETARMVQSTFFPKKDVQEGPLSVTGYYQPATECGGDLWGHYQVSDSKQIVFIADAMGHGAPAALVTAIGYATCQAVATILKDEPSMNASPGKLLERLNRIIYDAVEGKISMTFFGILIDFEAGTATFANAGHNFPVVMTNNNEDGRLSKQAKAKAANAYILPLQLQGTPLGVDREAEYKEKTIKIAAGDRIFFFTDGLIENQLVGQEPMGRKNLLEALSQFGNQDIHNIKQNMLDFATKTFGSVNLADDVTIVVAEISKDWVAGKIPATTKIDLPPTPEFKSGHLVTTNHAPQTPDANDANTPPVSEFKVKLPSAG